MAIRVRQAATTELRLAANITKGRDYQAPCVAPGTPIDGLIVGHHMHMFCMMPRDAFDTADYILAGSGSNSAFSGARDSSFRIASGARSVPWKPIYNLRGGGATAFVGSENLMSALDQVPDGDCFRPIGRPCLLSVGIQRTPSGTWRGWGAMVNLETGAITTYVAATPTPSAWLGEPLGTLMRAIFPGTAGSASAPAGLELEHLGLFRGNFPWDTTVNDRPHHDALAALAGIGSNPFLTYQGLIDAQAANSLPYPNLDQGKSVRDWHWTLADLTTGLQNVGTGGTNTLAVTPIASDSTGLVVVPGPSRLAPPHWYNVGSVTAISVTEPKARFVGGRGTRASVLSGTKDSSKTIQRRWTNTATGTVQPGFDWADVATQSGTTWSTNDLVPSGVYNLQLRYSDGTATEVTFEDWMVAKVEARIGQSGMEGGGLGFNDEPPGTNTLSLQVVSGAQGMAVKLENQNCRAFNSTTKARPQFSTVRMRSGEVPGCGSGYIASLNHHHGLEPGVPLVILNIAIGGTAMADWANGPNGGMAYFNNSTNGEPDFLFLGEVGIVPTRTNVNPSVVSGNNSGVLELYAQISDRFHDVVLLMWYPNVINNSTIRANFVAYWQVRFSNSPQAPWAIIFPWRGSQDGAQLLSSVAAHRDFVNQLPTMTTPVPSFLGPLWLDIVMDTGPETSLHSAWVLVGTAFFVSEANQVGYTRLAYGLAQISAWVFNRDVKAHGPLVIAAWSDDDRNTVNIELGREVRTLNSAAVDAKQFWVSLNNGGNLVRSDGMTWDLVPTGNPTFTVALSADNRRAILTPSDGGTAWRAAGSDLRVDYGRIWPNRFVETGDEALAERLLDGILYDSETYRGGTNFAPSLRPGNALQGTRRSGTGVIGVPVTLKGSPKLACTEKRPGGPTVTIRMKTADGLTVLAEKSWVINVT